MALPKKKTSKSRSSRRFSQYCFDRKKKLKRMADSLKHIGMPFIYDSSIVEEAKKTKVVKEEAVVEALKKDTPKKSSLKKVDDIKVTKKEADKKETKETDKTEKAGPTANAVPQKEGWFSNLFQNKGKGGSVNNMTKKNFRRKSM